MADISTEIAAFQNAVYGEEVRGSMISLAEKLNDVTEDCEADVASFETSITAAIADAETAAASANNAASSATSAASSATSAASSATTAATNATTAANNANTLNTNITSAENARVTAETARATAERSRASAETARATAESARANSETNRTSNEATRQQNESDRVTSENARISAEATRAAQENSRVSAETSRVSAETSRSTTFRQMQDAFAEMEQQVLPPATTSTLGGVIVGTGIEVDNNGVISFTSGDYLTTTEAAATYATITTVNGKANASHTHSATDVTDGTLPAARGGTGVTTAAAERERLGLGSTTDALPIANGGTGATTAAGAISALLGSDPLTVPNGGTGADTLTANAILAGNGTSAVNQVTTADGALYATSTNGAASFGTLPIAQGGTGATTAAVALTNLGAFPIAGGTITGDTYHDNFSVAVKSSNIDRDGAAPSSDAWGKSYNLQDKDGDNIGYLGCVQRTNGVIGTSIYAYNDNNGTGVSNALGVTVAKDGTQSYTVANPTAFRTVIDAARNSTLGVLAEAQGSSSSVSLANDTPVNLGSYTIVNPGSYIIVAQFRFDSNATGFRFGSISLTSADNTTNKSTTMVQTANGWSTFFPAVLFVNTSTSNVKYYFVGKQKSGGALGATVYYFVYRIK